MSKFLEFFGFVSPDEIDDEEFAEEGDVEYEEQNVVANRARKAVSVDDDRAASRAPGREGKPFTFVPSTAIDDQPVSAEGDPIEGFPELTDLSSDLIEKALSDAPQTVPEDAPYTPPWLSVPERVPEVEAPPEPTPAPSFTYRPFAGNVAAEAAPADAQPQKRSFAFVPPAVETEAEPAAYEPVEPEAEPVAYESVEAEAEPAAYESVEPEAEPVVYEPVEAEAEVAYEPAEPEATPPPGGKAARFGGIGSKLKRAFGFAPLEAVEEEETVAVAPEPPEYEPYEAPAREEADVPPLEQPAYEVYEAPVFEAEEPAPQFAAEPVVQEEPAPQFAAEPVIQEESAPQFAAEPVIQEEPAPPFVAEPVIQEEPAPPFAPVAPTPDEAGGVTAYTEAAGEEEQGTGETLKSVSIIAEDAYIDGNVTTSGNIEVLGGISGDVRAKGAVDIRGAIRGDVSGERLGLYGCTVQGDMRASAGILVDAESMVTGNVRTKNLYLDGKLKGNIESEEVSLLRSNAYYVGDLVTGSIAIEGGATIRGNIRTLIEGDVEDPFSPDRISDML
jgi:cytoskeletal protein CcmA (bactofilin family)